MDKTVLVGKLGRAGTLLRGSEMTSDGVSRVGIRADRTAWTDEGSEIVGGLEVLVNGKWLTWCSVRDTGGRRKLPDNADDLVAQLVCTPPPKGTLMRAFATATGIVAQDLYVIEKGP